MSRPMHCYAIQAFTLKYVPIVYLPQVENLIDKSLKILEKQIDNDLSVVWHIQ